MGEPKYLSIQKLSTSLEMIWINNNLVVSFIFDQFFGSTMKKPDMRVTSHNIFTMHFKNETQHTMGGRMLSNINLISNDRTNLMLILYLRTKVNLKSFQLFVPNGVMRSTIVLIILKSEVGSSG